MSYNLSTYKMAKRDTTLIEEDLEITAATYGAAPVQLPGKVISIFPALAHRNFQLYFLGQAISLVGFWLQQVGLGYFIFQLTNSAFWVGAVMAIGGLPFLFLTTFAGVLIDKVNKKKLLIWTQIIEAIIAAIMGFLILTGHANLTSLTLLVFLSGIAGSIDLPARLAFIVEMVGKRDLASAIPINNGLFNAARFIGPALAGGLIVTLGVGWVFIINALSFIAGIWAIANIKPVYSFPTDVNSHWQSLKTGLSYAFGHPKLFSLMTLATITAIFLWPYQTLMPVIAEKVYASGAGGLGSLLSAAGAGSLVGAIFTSSQSRRKERGTLVFFGLLISSLSLIAFAIVENFLLAHVLLAIAGFGMLVQVSTVNTLVQLAAPDQMRGRVMAVYITMFVGMMPLGNAFAGFLAQHTSPQFTVGLGGLVMLLVGIFMYAKGTFSNFKSAV